VLTGKITVFQVINEENISKNHVVLEKCNTTRPLYMKKEITVAFPIQILDIFL
jgi:hypothetical protein